jgi:regulator of protease activity HflC (stomatin/prohibitin superfamily)
MIDKGIKVDLREQSQSLTQVVSTGDFLRVSVDFGWRYRVADPARSVLEGQGKLEAEIRDLVESTLRSAVGALTADQLRFERGAIGETVRAKLQNIAEGRGVTITQAEIREIVRA